MTGKELEQAKTTPVLVFEAAGQRIGVALACVQEVLRAVAITPVPTGPDVLEGVIDLRGELIPIIDARARFALPRRPLTLTDHIVVAQAGRLRLGLRTDQAVEIAELPSAELSGAGVALGAFHGAVKLPSGLVFIHDVGSLLSAGQESSIRDAVRGLTP